MQSVAVSNIASHQENAWNLKSSEDSAREQKQLCAESDQVPAPKLSIVIPIFNDGYLADSCCERLAKVFSHYYRTENLDSIIEIIFIDDGSVDDSFDHLKKVAIKYPFTRAIQFSRNFGQQIALSCGYSQARGEVIGVLDVDLQDPPEHIPELLEHMRKNSCDVVQGIRSARKDHLFKRITSKGFVFVFNKLCGFQLPLNQSTLRIMNRKFIDSFNDYTERVRFVPGLESWLGFKREFVEVGHSKRSDGKSSYNFSKRSRLAVEALISFSDLPLKLSITCGLVLAIAGGFLGLAFIVVKLINPAVQPGFTSIISILLCTQGIVIFLLGIVGLYIARILKEVQNRPLYIVRQSFQVRGDFRGSL